MIVNLGVSTRNYYRRFLPVLVIAFLAIIFACVSSVWVIKNFLGEYLSLTLRESWRSANLWAVVLFFLIVWRVQDLKPLAQIFTVSLVSSAFFFIGDLDDAREIWLWSVFSGLSGVALLRSKRFSRAQRTRAALIREKSLRTVKLEELKLAEYVTWISYVGRFGGGLTLVGLSAVLSCVVTASLLMAQLYTPGAQMLRWILIANSVGTLLLVPCCFLQFRAHVVSIWMLFLTLAICSSLCAMQLFETQHRVITAMALGLSTLGLLVMSTRKYRRAIKIMAVGERVRRRLSGIEKQLLGPP